MNLHFEGVLTDLNLFLSKHPPKNSINLEETKKIVLYLFNLNSKLKQEIASHQFNEPQEEINYFKHFKPLIISKLIVYNTLYRIQAEKPSYCVKSEYRYYKRELEKLQLFFQDNQDFYKYFKTKSTHLDTKFFIRNKHNIKMLLDSHIAEFDFNYTTSHCFKLAQVMANDELKSHLEQQLAKFHQIPQKSSPPVKPKIKLMWSDDKSNLVELLYALQEQKSINEGKLEIKELIESFEQIFDIQLKDFYHTFTRMKKRKGIPTKYLDKLKESLLNRVKK